MYVIVRTDGAFIAPSGFLHSYVRDVGQARIFQTRMDAERERCPLNERVVSLEDCVRRA